jgi:hypothetical protein
MMPPRGPIVRAPQDPPALRRFVSRRRFLRDLQAGRYLDLFLVAAVASVLAIRFGLHVAGYPRISPGALHIAHMLWGGLLMLVALVILFSFIGRRVHDLAALLGGVGFGTFIDEVGKFVTQDNDYFYRPAISLIYISFILLYLATRSIHRRREATPEEYLVNALQELEEIALRELDEEERERALRYLDRSDPEDPLVPVLRQLIQDARTVPVNRPGAHLRLWAWAVEYYRRLATLPLFGRAIIILFVGQLVVKLGAVLAIALDVAPAMDALGLEEQSVVAFAQLGSTWLSAVLVAIGVYRIRGSRLEGLRWFQRSILVSIFLTQVFVFYQHEWAALGGLTLDLLLFFALGFMIERERSAASASGGDVALQARPTAS